jgi:Ankyrin repeats (many copies)
MSSKKILLSLLTFFLLTGIYAETRETNKIIYDILNDKDNSMFFVFKKFSESNRNLFFQNGKTAEKLIFSLLLQKPDVEKMLQKKSIDLNTSVVIDSCELNNGFQVKIMSEAACATDVKYIRDAAQMTLTPLQATCLTGDLAAMKMLIKAGASANNNPETLSPLESCLATKKFNHVIFLLDQGANVNNKNKHSYFSPLTTLSLVSANDTDQITAARLAKIMISKGADLHYRDKDGDGELHAAAGVGNLAIVKLLVELGMDINAKNEAGLSPLGAAEKNNKPEVVEFLKSKGAQR